MAGIFVYGGCVTRDTFEFMKDKHSLTGYIARQSLISAASPETTLAKPVSGENFEARAVQGDLSSSMHGALRDSAGETDLLVMDLLVERFGVLALPDGAYVTRTPNMRQSGAIDELWPELYHIKMGKDAHFELWAAAAERLVAVLRETGLLERTLLINTPWAEVTDCGVEVPPFAGWTATGAAAIFERYYAHLQDLGVKCIRIPDELVLSSAAHRWGPSPYHYATPAYEWMRDEICAALPAST